jgi:hypothetical protein
MRKHLIDAFDAIDLDFVLLQKAREFLLFLNIFVVVCYSAL